MAMETDHERALRLAVEAGHILLENGAEISRVEETMQRISAHYGVEDQSFFVLSNGIIATGRQYASAKFIPIQGTQLSKVVEINQLSRDVSSASSFPLDELERRLGIIRSAPGKPWWELILAVALGVSAFSILFGGSLFDALATFCCGLLLGGFMAFIGGRLSHIFKNLLGGFLGGLLCILAVSVGLGDHLPNMIIGTIIALVPGVPFTNGIRDLANEDYLAGATRLLDAFLGFLCIALGVVLALLLQGWVTGAFPELGTAMVDPVAAAWPYQLLAAFVGTVAFSILFGSPVRFFIDCGITGMLGWAMYLLMIRYGGFSVAGAAFIAALLVGLTGSVQAMKRRCPVTLFLIGGIIPLVPGGGIFWTAYYLVAEQLSMAATTGFVALKVTIAIAGGIIVAAAVIEWVAPLMRHITVKHKRQG